MRSAPKCILMLGMHPKSKAHGGIYSVVLVYRDKGLFDRWPIRYLGTVTAGSVVSKCTAFIVAMSNYLRLILFGKVALVHVHSASRASFWRKSIFMAVAFATRTPVIFHLHGGQFGRFYRRECGPIRRWLVRSILRRVDRVVVLSSHARDLMRDIAPSARVVTIPNPIEVPRDRPIDSARARCSALFLGRITRAKGVHDLLSALAIVRRTFPEVRLRCGGEGDIAAMREHARAMGIEDAVDFLGWVGGTDKERELSQTTVYVLPSYAEGMPMGVLEAMAAGAPVVATSVGGIPDAIEDGIEGFLVAPGDTTALANRIERVLGSIELQRTFAMAALDKAQRLFSAEKVLAKVEALYSSLGATPEDRQPRDEEVGARLVRAQE